MKVSAANDIQDTQQTLAPQEWIHNDQNRRLSGPSQHVRPINSAKFVGTESVM